MPSEPVRLHTRDKRVVDGEAEVVRLGAVTRALRAGGLVIAGVVLGVGSLVVPVAHLFLPWMLPIIGVIAAVVVYRMAIEVPEVRVTCPECATAAVIEGGAWEDPLWLRCPTCQLPLRVELVEGG